jgi:hypothetical protein
MDYKNIFELADTYPDPTKYNSKRVKNMRLSGKYVEVNYIDFDIPSVEDITLVPGTTFRFILVIKDSAADFEPKYFMSDSFYSDIELSQIENNPYFIRAALKDIFAVTITLDKQIELFNTIKLLDIAAGVKTYKNLFIGLGDDNTTGGNVIDYEGLVRYIDWVVGPVNPLDNDGTDGVLPVSKIADYEIGSYDAETGEFVSRAEQKLRNKLEDLYDELQAINDTLDQISSEVREPQKKKTTVLEGIMLGLSVVCLVGGVSGLAKQIKKAKDFNDSIGATKEAVKQSKNVQKLSKSAKPLTVEQIKKFEGQKITGIKLPSAPQSLPAGVPRSITSVGGVTYDLSGGVAAGKTLGQTVKGAAKSVAGGVKEANKAISKVTDFAGGIVQAGIKKVAEKVVKAAVSAISKKAAASLLKVATGPIGMIAAATVGITKFFIGKAEEKKRFEAEKKEYAVTINQVERLHTRKAEIENEIEGILSGKITLDVPPLSDTKLTATQRYLQRYGKSVLDKIVVSGG